MVVVFCQKQGGCLVFNNNILGEIIKLPPKLGNTTPTQTTTACTPTIPTSNQQTTEPTPRMTPGSTVPTAPAQETPKIQQSTPLPVQPWK